MLSLWLTSTFAVWGVPAAYQRMLVQLTHWFMCTTAGPTFSTAGGPTPRTRRRCGTSSRFRHGTDKQARMCFSVGSSAVALDTFFRFSPKTMKFRDNLIVKEPVFRSDLLPCFRYCWHNKMMARGKQPFETALAAPGTSHHLSQWTPSATRRRTCKYPRGRCTRTFICTRSLVRSTYAKRPLVRAYDQKKI